MCPMDYFRSKETNACVLVSSLVPSTPSNFLQRTANYGNVASRTYAEIRQKIVNLSISCTEFAQQPTVSPKFLQSLTEIDLMVKCNPCTPTCLYKKITEIENHHTRIVTKLGEVEWVFVLQQTCTVLLILLSIISKKFPLHSACKQTILQNESFPFTINCSLLIL